MHDSTHHYIPANSSLLPCYVFSASSVCHDVPVGFGVDGTVSVWTCIIADQELSIVMCTVIKICKAACFNLHLFLLTSSSLRFMMYCVPVKNAMGCDPYPTAPTSHSGKKVISRTYTLVSRQHTVWFTESHLLPLCIWKQRKQWELDGILTKTGTQHFNDYLLIECFWGLEAEADGLYIPVSETLQLLTHKLTLYAICLCRTVLMILWCGSGNFKIQCTEWRLSKHIISICIIVPFSLSVHHVQ
jgi:hypothetical protein